MDDFILTNHFYHVTASLQDVICVLSARLADMQKCMKQNMLVFDQSCCDDLQHLISDLIPIQEYANDCAHRTDSDEDIGTLCETWDSLTYTLDVLERMVANMLPAFQVMCELVDLDVAEHSDEIAKVEDQIDHLSSMIRDIIPRIAEVDHRLMRIYHIHSAEISYATTEPEPYDPWDRISIFGSRQNTRWIRVSYPLSPIKAMISTLQSRAGNINSYLKSAPTGDVFNSGHLDAILDQICKLDIALLEYYRYCDKYYAKPYVIEVLDPTPTWDSMQPEIDCIKLHTDRDQVATYITSNDSILYHDDQSLNDAIDDAVRINQHMSEIIQEISKVDNQLRSLYESNREEIDRISTQIFHGVTIYYR